MLKPSHLDFQTPRILVVDDERQIQASLRLRLARDYEVVCCSHARDALTAVSASRFDLCIVDIHMPEMDGLTFIETAQRADPSLGYVVLSAFDSNENLRRTIPLHVFDFIGKPLPERHEFEARIPSWIERTRAQRREQALTERSKLIDHDLESARLEREVELVASETARDALLQTSNLLTTIQAHLVSAAALSASRARSDPIFSQLSRNLEEARKTASAAVIIADGFFGSAYATRDSSPAVIDSGLRQAVGIANRMSSAEAANKAVDLTSSVADEHVSVQGLTGIEFLLMVAPLVSATLRRAAANTTVGINVQPLARLDVAIKEPSFRGFLWANRKTALLSQRGVLITITAAAPALSRDEAEAWLKGDAGPLSSISVRGVVAGVQKCRGFLAVSLSPGCGAFQLALAVPV